MTASLIPTRPVGHAGVVPDVPDPEVPAKPSGDWVFLEVNPNGQWAWLEQATQLPISSAIADVLAEGGARVR